MMLIHFLHHSAIPPGFRPKVSHLRHPNLSTTSCCSGSRQGCARYESTFENGYLSGKYVENPAEKKSSRKQRDESYWHCKIQVCEA